jgi:hypothetical protein
LLLLFVHEETHRPKRIFDKQEVQKKNSCKEKKREMFLQIFSSIKVTYKAEEKYRRKKKNFSKKRRKKKLILTDESNFR